ncbi:MAG: DNA-protecting protein DprA [Armatimonadetes bacterium]|nr:DNA-protecting protein DprA [Armatimonadota bacterium]
MGLSLLPGVGPRTIRRWVERAGSASAVWRHLPAFAEPVADREEVLTSWRSLNPAAVVETARAQGMAVLVPGDAAFPALLRLLPDPPPVLYVRGRLGKAPSVAVVGSRRATPYGRAAAARLAFDLALAGVTVVSGLARGIDAAAHRAALDGGGRTVAVLGNGADVVYPPEHAALVEAIIERGALVTEFSPGTPPRPGHFPRRNRLISGLSLGVVVVEGAEDSGALITVEYALDQGREVFAVPGSIFSEGSRAPHGLLRQGARVVERAEDILEELNLSSPGTVGPDQDAAQDAAPGASGEASGQQRVFDALAAGPRSLDDLVETTGLPAAEVAAAISLLEIRGLVATLPGQMVMRTPGAPPARR